jgi:beta-propeller repeat-containing protein
MRVMSSFLSIVLSVAFSLPLMLPSPVHAQPADRDKVGLSGLPLPFIENRGVHPPEVRYYLRGADRSVFFLDTGLVYRFHGDNPWTLKVEFVGVKASPRGELQAPAVVNYFTGPRDTWKTGLRTYHRLVYPDLWAGVDLAYEWRNGRLKYEAIVKPGADVAAVRFGYRGVDTIERMSDGGLRITTQSATIEEKPPVAYQDVDGVRSSVTAAFELMESKAAVGFRVGSYNRHHPLVIDPPVIIYCGYIGGQYATTACDIAVDSQGCAYVVGYTISDEKTFPVAVGPDLIHNSPPPVGAFDGFIAKVQADGRGLEYCGFIGGNSYDTASSVVVDACGAAYIAGLTYSLPATFPLTVGPFLVPGGYEDTFVAKVQPDGRGLEYCGYIGGDYVDRPHGIAIDTHGAAYVVGRTDSAPGTFPLTIGPDLTSNGNQDAFVAKVRPDGRGLEYCGYIGGDGWDEANDVAVDTAGNAYVVGVTASRESTFPVRVGPDLTFNFTTGSPERDAFVAKVRSDGSALDYCGYIGGARWTEAFGVAVDNMGRAYVAGGTLSPHHTFPVTVGPDLTFNDTIPNFQGDGFVARVSQSGSHLEYCGYIGGVGSDGCVHVEVDAIGRAYVGGATCSSETSFPVRLGPSLVHSLGVADGYVARVNPSGTALEFCGYLGGSDREGVWGLAIDRRGNHVYVADRTYSDESVFPVRVGPDLTKNTPRGNPDAYVAKITITSLTLAGTGEIGSNVILTVMDEPGRRYQLGSSLGTGPIAIGMRTLDLSLDTLLVATVQDVWPGLFQGYAGVLDSQGYAKAEIRIPALPALIGVRIHTAFVTLDAGYPFGIYSISDTVSFTIQH